MSWQNVPPKRRWTCTEVHEVTFQNAVLFIRTGRTNTLNPAVAEGRPLFEGLPIRQSQNTESYVSVIKLFVVKLPLSCLCPTLCFTLAWRGENIEIWNNLRDEGPQNIVGWSALHDDKTSGSRLGILLLCPMEVIPYEAGLISQ
jgi:hypothetical protein